MPPDQVIADALARHLTVELDTRGIDLCEGSAAPHRPVGRVLLRVERAQAGRTTALIRIGDEVTDKRIERTMDLTDVPTDSRPLSVAAAADELLRASWAELLIEDAPPPRTQPPPAVIAAVHSTTRPIVPGPPRFESGVFVSGSAFPHRTGIGGGWLVEHGFSRGIAAVLRTGFERGLETSSTHGTVRADTTTFGVGLEYTLTASAIGVHLGGDMRVLQVHYSASASTGNVGRDSNDWAWLSAWGPRFCLDVAEARISLAAAALVGMRPSRASDAGQEISSLGRLGGEATLGLSLRL